MGALDGLKLIDLSAYAPGRFATMMFADLGAEVIGIEVASGGRKGEFKTLEDDTHPRWLWHQRNKKSMTLNLKAEEGLKIFRNLVAKADIIVEAFRPGTAKRLQIDYETLKSVNPRIIYCAISGYGQDGPYAQLMNHEANYQALSGLMERNRLREGEPHMSSAFLGDLAGGSMNAVVAILAAVIHLQRTGEGQYIDVSMTAGLLPLLGYHSYSNQMPPTPRLMSTESPAHNIVPEQAVYRTKDGKHVAISIAEPWLFKRACETLGCAEIIPNHFTDDEQLRQRTFDRLQEVFLLKTRDEWEKFNFENDLGISPVKNLDEVFVDPQMLHRGMIIEYDYKPVGKSKHVGVPFLMSRTPANSIRSIPRFGEHTDSILAELGYSQAQIAGSRQTASARFEVLTSRTTPASTIGKTCPGSSSNHTSERKAPVNARNRGQLMIIDAHAHLVTPLSLLGVRSALQVSGGQHSLEFIREMLPQTDIDSAVERNLRLMDQVGTDLQILSPRPFTLMHSHHSFHDVDLWVRLQNDIIYNNVQKHPTRFRGMAALPQVNGLPIETTFEELDRTINELNFVGILVNPDPSEGKGDSPHLGESYWNPLWAKASALDVPILIHSAGCCGRETYDEHFATEESMAITKVAHTDIFDRHPNLKLIISHGGGAIPYQIGRWRSHWLVKQGASKPHIAEYFKEVENAAKAGAKFPARPADLETFDDVLQKFYFDTDVHDPDSMELLFAKVGVDRCLFGTERPGSGGGLNLETGRALDDLKFTIDNIASLTAGDRRKLYQDNALSVFKRIPRELVASRISSG